MRTILHLFLALLLLVGTVNVSIAQGSNPDTTQVRKELTVYVTNTGEKYHGTNCGYLHSSKIAMKLSAAKGAGYTACSRCNGSNSYVPGSSSGGSYGGSSGTSVQCSGITQKGARCKRRTTSASGRCWQH